MNSSSSPTPSQVVDDLGPEMLDLFVDAVGRAREDYRLYRRTHPDWVADQTARTGASWIHDRIWSHLRSLLDAVAGVTFVDADPTREFSVNSRYVLRVKRHNDGDGISSYPTTAALDFWADRTPSLDGLEVHNLALGYRWDAETQQFGEAVLSYRTEMGRPRWVIELLRAAADAPVTWRPVQTPALPELDLSGIGADSGEEIGSGS